MKHALLLAVLAALAGCSSTTYTEATRADGSTVKHISIAAGTKIKTTGGGCIDSTESMTSCPTDAGQ